MKINRLLHLIIIFLIFYQCESLSQDKKIPVIDSQIKEKTVKKICTMLNENYVFPATAKKITEFLKSQLSSKAYDGLDDPRIFAETLTKDVQFISNDKHLRIYFNPDAANRLKDEEKNGPDPDQEKQYIEELKSQNFGFRKTERLNGNIGYVDFRHFADAKYAKETIASVMDFLKNTNAIIFDIRMNGGGDPACVQLICSYLFGDKPVHLNDLYYRPDDKTEEYWTLRKVDGKKMPDIPVYVLTSCYTFSGAEEFTYNLKNLKRATIIGETTGGGAHPGGTMPVNDMFVIFMPTGRAINPITNTNWEGTGITPDILVPSENALETAQVLALNRLADNSKEQQVKKYYLWIAESIESAMNAPLIDDKILQTYAGSYGDRKIIYSTGKLYYQRGKRQKMLMTYMGNDTFMFKDIEFFRLKIDKDAEGKITGVTGLYDNGDTDNSPKTD